MEVPKTLMFSLEGNFLIISKLVFWSKIRQEQNIKNFSILKSLIDHLFASSTEFKGFHIQIIYNLQSEIYRPIWIYT